MPEVLARIGLKSYPPRSNSSGNSRRSLRCQIQHGGGAALGHTRSMRPAAIEQRGFAVMARQPFAWDVSSVSSSSSMGKTAAHGAAYVGAAQGLRVVLTILSTMVVARILSPSDYGVIAMSSPIAAFLLLFQNLGLSQAAIQARALTSEQSNALFWVNMAASLGITIILLAISPFVAWFYDDPRPAYITAASAATVLLSGSAIQHTALLNREFRFATISRIDMASALVAFAATVVCALLLKSYWALWLGPFISSVFTRSIVWRVSKWRPSFPITFKGSGGMVRFGGSLTVFNLLNFFSRNADNILIARIWGAAPLGLYDRSYKLMMFPIQNINAPLARVMLPILSRMQDEPERYRRTFLMAFRALLLVITPSLAVACATSDRLVPFLLGQRWAAAAPIFYWLSLAAFMQPAGNASGWLFVTSGRGRALMRWGLVSSTSLVAGFVVGVRWGAVGVATAYFIVITALMPPLFAWSARDTPVRALDLYAVCLPSVVGVALTWPLVTVLSPALGMIPLLIVSLLIAYAFGILCHAATPAGRDALRTLLLLALQGLRLRR